MVKLLHALFATSALLVAATGFASAKENTTTTAAANTTATVATTTGGGDAFKGTPPLVIKGYRFFNSASGEYFGVRGVNYYPRPNTGALDANNLDMFSKKFARLRTRDFPQFVALNANAIRLYAVDPDADHTDFMCELQAEGIYVMVDLGSSCEGCEITSDAAPACYPASYKTRGEKIIAQFAKFDNVIGFSGGNEVNHRSAGKGLKANAPCQKMFVRDMRNYIASCKDSGMRQVPVGLVTADSDRDVNALYYNCQSSDLKYERAEWYGLNTYIQCDDIDDPKKAAGFNILRDSFKGHKYSIPVILTEFGCTTDRFPTVKGATGIYKGQRTFHDAAWMNSPDYSEYFAGGFAFEYSTENANSKSTSVFPFTEFGPQNYGLGYLSPEDCDDVTKECKYEQMPNFNSLAAAYKQVGKSSEPTLATFKPAADRLAPSQCPPDYLPIGDLTWAGGKDPLTKCPAVAKFQCPNTIKRKPRLAGVGADNSTSTSPSNATKNSNTTDDTTDDNEPTPSPSPTPKPTPSKARPTTDDSSSGSTNTTDSKNNDTSGRETSVKTTSSATSAVAPSGLLTVGLAVALTLLQLL
ncbi:hypothetical protein Gpo141_00009550 [Globisporangium polare]